MHIAYNVPPPPQMSSHAHKKSADSNLCAENGEANVGNNPDAA